MLKILDSEQVEFGTLTDFTYSDSLKTSLNGKLGAVSDSLIYIKNDDNTLYYTGVTLSPVSADYNDIAAEWGETGFGIKCLYGERQPTETEWDQVKYGESIVLPNIGSTSGADTENYYPVWVRAMVPGMTAAQIKSNLSLKLSYRAKNIGT